MALLSITDHWRSCPLIGGEIPFPAVARTVGFGLETSKMFCCLSRSDTPMVTGSDDLVASQPGRERQCILRGYGQELPLSRLMRANTGPATWQCACRNSHIQSSVKDG